jgi:hypothetical protein
MYRTASTLCSSCTICYLLVPNNWLRRKNWTLLGWTSRNYTEGVRWFNNNNNNNGRVICFAKLRSISMYIYAKVHPHHRWPWCSSTYSLPLKITSPLISSLHPLTNSHSELLHFITQLLWFVCNIVLYS